MTVFTNLIHFNMNQITKALFLKIKIIKSVIFDENNNILKSFINLEKKEPVH